MKTDLKEPCSACPFRRKSLAGWLGPWEPNELTHSIKGTPFPCHKTIQGEDIGFDDPRFTKMQSCAGAAIFLANQCALPRDPETLEHVKKLKALPNYSELSAGVFQWPSEFIAHHEAGLVTSWNMRL